MNTSRSETLAKFLPITLFAVITLFLAVIFLVPTEHYEAFGTAFAIITAIFIFGFLYYHWLRNPSTIEEETNSSKNHDRNIKTQLKHTSFWSKAPGYLVFAFFIVLLIGFMIFKIFFLY